MGGSFDVTVILHEVGVNSFRRMMRILASALVVVRLAAALWAGQTAYLCCNCEVLRAIILPTYVFSDRFRTDRVRLSAAWLVGQAAHLCCSCEVLDNHCFSKRILLVVIRWGLMRF